MIANTLHLAAERHAHGTILARAYAGGLWRTSRAFREGSATRVVTAQLGPGMIRGDHFTTHGTVGPGAHLIVAGQMATRILPGDAPVTTTACWTVAPGGTLELRNEPTIVTAGAALDARLSIELEGSAHAVITDIVSLAAGATVRTAMKVERDGHVVLVDVLQLDEAAANEDRVIGTLTILRPVNVADLDQAADACPNVRIGIGTYHQGDTLVRIAGTAVMPVREALTRLHESLHPPGAREAAQRSGGHSEPAKARRAESAVQT